MKENPKIKGFNFNRVASILSDDFIQKIVNEEENITKYFPLSENAALHFTIAIKNEHYSRKQLEQSKEIVYEKPKRLIDKVINSIKSFNP